MKPELSPHLKSMMSGKPWIIPNDLHRNALYWLEHAGREQILARRLNPGSKNIRRGFDGTALLDAVQNCCEFQRGEHRFTSNEVEYFKAAQNVFIYLSGILDYTTGIAMPEVVHTLIGERPQQPGPRLTWAQGLLDVVSIKRCEDADVCAYLWRDVQLIRESLGLTYSGPSTQLFDDPQVRDLVGGEAIELHVRKYKFDLHGRHPMARELEQDNSF